MLGVGGNARVGQAAKRRQAIGGSERNFMAVLVTGGAGYIGSHTCVELQNAGYDVVVADNLCNSSRDAIARIEKITGKTVPFYELDICDAVALDDVFKAHSIEAVLHFAGLKAVGESVKIPLSYYRNNIEGTLSLCETMQKHGVKRLVFSSSATVYSADNAMPLGEDAKLGCTNPYGWTKLMIEQILRDVSAADPSTSIALLRYFNPIGAHKSGLIGENPRGIPNNLLPYIALVATGKMDALHVFGSDYPTKDGTGVRDYIHVEDLAKGHVGALRYTASHRGVEAVNLGTGRGYSVLEVVAAFERASGKKIPYVVEARRAGDIAVCYAKTEKAKALLNWQAEKDIDEMCADAWRWTRTL